MINFKAEVLVKEKECARVKESRQEKLVTEIGFGLDGFSKDRLRVEVRCEECDCADRKVPNAPACSGNGLLVCGGCECNPGVIELD